MSELTFLSHFRSVTYSIHNTTIVTFFFENFNHILKFIVVKCRHPPQTILSRRFKIMSELTFEQMLEESFKTIHTGEVVEGTVIDVKPEEIILNIGYKSDGVLTRNEYN